MKSDAPVVLDVRAVDVGYFSTKFTLGRKQSNGISQIATSMFPSLAPRLSSGASPMLATQGSSDGALVCVQDVRYFVGRDVAVHCSAQEPREVLENYSSTNKYLALVHGAFHYMFQDAGATSELVIRNLVVGLPLNNYSAHHEQLSERVCGEHLLPDPRVDGAFRRVTVENVIVMVQPQGALINVGMRHREKTAGWSLVVDAGGGTLDWYLARGRTPNWQRSGAYPKSMLACSYAVADLIKPTWRDSFEIVERIDNAIRERQPHFTVAGNQFEMSAFSTAIESVLMESTDKMLSKVGSIDTLDAIIFTGGGGGVFYDYFVKRFAEHSIIMHMDQSPVFSNVMGFHVVGEVQASVQ